MAVPNSKVPNKPSRLKLSRKILEISTDEDSFEADNFLFTNSQSNGPILETHSLVSSPNGNYRVQSLM